MIAIDTNLLIYAHRSKTPEHATAKKALQQAAEHPGGWGIPLPCMAEFWSVVTHPRAAGRPSTPFEAAGFLRALIESGGVHIWLPGPGFGNRLMRVAEQVGLSGTRVFDLQIALVASEAGAREMWSHDRRFQTVPGMVLHDPLG